MKKRAWVLLLLMVLAACRLFQHKSKSEQQSSMREQQKNTFAQWLYTQSRDSLTRSWYFWTDSGLRFHPDSGLSSQGGRLLLKESRASNSVQQQKTSVDSELSKENKDRVAQLENTTYKLPYQWGALLVLVLLFLYGIRKKWTKLCS